MNSLFMSLVKELEKRGRELATAVDELPLPEKVEALNRIRAVLHEVSPFKTEPVDLVVWVPADSVKGNDYNPNNVARPEMKLLERSIEEDGVTQPVVTYLDDSGREVVDGFHRTKVIKTHGRINKRVHGYAPCTTINHGRADLKDRMAATIRHNRARGVHGVMPMTEIVATLIRNGWEDDRIAKELGMDADEVLRFKQTSGISSLFENHEYSKAWE